MNPLLVEGQFGHGGLGHFIKPADWLYHNFTAKDSTPFDWSKGYNVEDELGYKLAPKNQGTSGSCGGQAVALYDEVLKDLGAVSPAERSAVFIYRQTFQPGGGTMGGDLMALVKNKGVSEEILCPSYVNGQPMTEEQMETVVISQAAFQGAVSAESTGYSFIVDFDIDTLAQACRDNHGIVIGILGQNNGTWLTQFPAVPTASINSKLLWGHWVYVCGAQMINGVKYLIIVNSWGPTVGVNGKQWISHDYVDSGFVSLGMAMMFPTKYIFNNYLSIGMASADVFFLQKTLNLNPATQVAVSGPGSPGNETYYFGSLTQAAVIKFQKLHGIQPIGCVGPLTRAALNA